MNNIIKAKIKTLEEVLKIEWKKRYTDVGNPWISSGMLWVFWNTHNASLTGRWYYYIEWWLFKKEWVGIEMEKTNYNITIKI